MTNYISECGYCHETQFTGWYSKYAPRDMYGRVDRDYCDGRPVAYCSEEHRDAADALLDAQRAEIRGSDPEVQRLRTERDRYRRAWRMAYQRARGRGWAADRAGARATELHDVLQTMLFTVIASQIACKVARDEAAELRALLGAQPPVNESLVKAREAAAAMFEVEAGERRPMWRIIITDSESPTGVAPVCTAEGDADLHLWANFGNGIERVVDGVWDCCPDPQFDTYSTVLAAYLVELLNADTETRSA